MPETTGIPPSLATEQDYESDIEFNYNIYRAELAFFEKRFDDVIKFVQEAGCEVSLDSAIGHLNRRITPQQQRQLAILMDDSSPDMR